MKYIILIIFLFTAQNYLNAKIYKRVNKDGTITYFNTPTYKYHGKKRFVFSSKYDHLIHKYAKKNAIDPYLIKCIIRVESNFQPDAVSTAGAMGLMQLMQATAEYYTQDNPMDPETNIRVGVRHFAHLMRYFKNDVPLALAAYHAGLGRVKRHMAVPPIKSTIHYVNTIMYFYTGKKSFSKKVKRLYKRILKDGTLLIYSR